MKPQTKPVNKEYQYIEKNIYKTGNSYRTRVGQYTENSDTLTEARKARSRFKRYQKTQAGFSWS